MSDYVQPVTPSDKGRKKLRNSQEWVKNKKRKCRNSVEARGKPYVSCNHNDDHWCKASTLNSEDIDGKNEFWISNCVRFHY